MNTKHHGNVVLSDPKINIKIKLSGLWATVLFLFIYVDYFGLFIPGVLEKIIAGEVAHTGLLVSQTFLLSVFLLMLVPSMMIFLSLALPARINRIVNIVVGTLKIAVLIAGVIGESWYYYIFATIVEVTLIALIIWHAVKWPKQENTRINV